MSPSANFLPAVQAVTPGSCQIGAQSMNKDFCFPNPFLALLPYPSQIQGGFGSRAGLNEKFFDLSRAFLIISTP